MTGTMKTQKCRQCGEACDRSISWGPSGPYFCTPQCEREEQANNEADAAGEVYAAACERNGRTPDDR